ncbi:angiogenic factor with G patch and FHA domains 1 isoform X1 [Chelonus insularis]|uniref:angiogenic factor with G patch and FHA domains 1 isoform X1 n=1 Tax=Chelonus insularis TaxID=460826 RepID=UPI00158AA2ED|nr:angiogenic factor with G patch and FHA domains 1 isoform X1 [Chelonus insularis]
MDRHSDDLIDNSAIKSDSNKLMAIDDESKLIETIPVDLLTIIDKYPELKKFINTIQDYIKCQRRVLEDLHKELKNKVKLDKSRIKKPKFEHKGVQTDAEIIKESNLIQSSQHGWETDNTNNSGSITDQVKQAAELTLQQSGFVYEETSGLYYDYNTGYYYDATQKLYYDGNSGIYYYYDDETKTYKFHSQTQVTPVERSSQKRKLKKKKRLTSKPSEMINKSVDGHSEEQKDAPEEGECSGSESSSGSEYFSSGTSSSGGECVKDDQDIAKNYPPCMRIIVKETNLQLLKIGSLFIITFTGGSLGREGDHSVLIPDINISKHHAKFQYDQDKRQYEIIDLGSRNGTYVNGKRLSVAKQESEPLAIIHGSIVQVGNTKLLCHVHNGYETCGHCEPGLVQQSSDTTGDIISIKSQHKSELKRLKNKFGVDKDNTLTASQVAPGYHDRAQARRECVGSSDHNVKTQQSSVEMSIAKDNKGFKLLSKMGWLEGQSIGKSGDGRTEPVPLTSNNVNNKAGLGASSKFPSIEVDIHTEKKHSIWKKARQRYNQLDD